MSVKQSLEFLIFCRWSFAEKELLKLKQLNIPVYVTGKNFLKATVFFITEFFQQYLLT